MPESDRTTTRKKQSKHPVMQQLKKLSHYTPQNNDVGLTEEEARAAQEREAELRRMQAPPRIRPNNTLIYSTICATLAFFIALVAMILINITFSYWSPHPSINDGLNTDHQISIFGEPAVRLGSAEFFLLDAMIFGSEFVQLTQIDGQLGMVFVIQAPPSTVVDFFPGEMSIAINPNQAAFEQQIMADSFVFISDQLLKENIQPLSQLDSVSVLMQLKPKTYQFKGIERTRLGFLAQDVQAVIPEAISYVNDLADANSAPSSESLMGVDIVSLLTHTVNALQNMELRIRSLEDSIIRRK